MRLAGALFLLRGIVKQNDIDLIRNCRVGRELEKRGSRPRLTIAEGLEICVYTLFFDRAGVRLKTDTQSVRMRDGIRLYWDRDETAGLLYAMTEISADERLTAVMEVLEERGITTETLAEITGVDLDLIESAREYPAKTDYRTK